MGEAGITSHVFAPNHSSNLRTHTHQNPSEFRSFDWRYKYTSRLNDLLSVVIVARMMWCAQHLMLVLLLCIYPSTHQYDYHPIFPLLFLLLRMFGSARCDSIFDSVRYLAVWLPIVYGQFTVVFRSLYPAFATQKILNTSHCNVNLCKYQFSTSWQTMESEREWARKWSAESERERERMEIDRFN